MKQEAMSKTDWLKARSLGISGTGASAIMGQNPYMSNVEYWERLTGRAKAPDISDKPVVKYGNDAEQHLIDLFQLDFPQYKVAHKDFDLRKHPEYDFIIGSIDGRLTDENGRNGILEIKTTNIMRQSQLEKWQDGIPNNYFWQVVHYLLVTGYDFVVLKAQLKRNIWSDMYLETRHYFFERSDVQDIIDDLLQKEIEFWELVKKDQRPALILPQI